MLPGMNRYLPAALLTAACLLTACDPATSPAPDPTSPTVGITTHSVVTSGTGQTPTGAPASGLAVITAISDWWTGGGQAHTNQITTDLGKITADSASPTAIGTDCAALSRDISTAQSYKPIPDTVAQQHWSAALDQYQQAATDCQAGVTATDASLIQKAGTEITAGSSELQQATARINQITASG